VKRRRAATLAIVTAAIAIVGLGAGAQPASAGNHSIEMIGPIRVAEGEPALIKVQGVVAPPAEYWDESWIEVVALPAAQIPQCPGDAQSAGNAAEEVGNILAIAQHPNADAAGNFENSVAIRGGAAGTVLVCAYLYNGEGQTWAATGMWIEVVHAGPTGPVGGSSGSSGSRPTANPVNRSRPWISHAGKRLVCHRGKWSNARSYKYNWYIDGSLREETSPRPIAPLPAFRGHRFSCKVTAYNPAGAASARSPTVRLH
jgi:hypothetical protein